jgi:hypothetical protein
VAVACLLWLPVSGTKSDIGPGLICAQSAKFAPQQTGSDVRTTNHDPVKLFRWNKPTKQRGLVDEIEFIAPGKHPETGALIMLAKGSTDGLVPGADGAATQ